MFTTQVIGHIGLKKQLVHAVERGHTPHAQLFVDENGYGGLPLALFVALGLLYPKKELETKKEAGNSAFKLLEHPDLHFVYPVVNLSGKTKTLSEDYLQDWRSFIAASPYGAYTDWFSQLNAGNKQGAIAVHEVETLHQKMYLKSYMGGNKVCVIWGMDKMNATASNKFLKLLEEPPKNTFFILVAAETSALLPTIISRCQVTELKPIATNDLKSYLARPEFEGQSLPEVEQLAGSMRNLHHFLNTDETHDFEAYLIDCLRTAFKAKGNKTVVIALMQWVDDICLLGREDQKAFLLYAINFLRNAFLVNYQIDSLVHFESKNNFDLHKLAPFVHSGNYSPLIALFENTYRFIERNGNAKMLFTDLSLQITRLLNRSA